MQAESKVASFINSLKFQTSASIFCLGYWFIWNSPFEFLPRLATLTVKVFDKISHLCTINLHLKSDSLAQVVSIVLLLALSFLCSQTRYTKTILRHLSWTPMFLLFAQLMIYGCAKIGGHQFTPIALFQNTANSEVQLWTWLSSHQSLVIVLGVIQVVSALAILLFPNKSIIKLLVILIFSSILIINIWFEVSVIIHTMALLLVSIYFFYNKDQTDRSKVSYFFQSISLSGIFIECGYLLGWYL